jgi:hypothetical protein
MLTERMRRRSARDDRKYEARLQLYADLLQAAAKITDNARTWSAIPLAQLDEVDDAVLDRVLAQVRVSASDRVKDAVFAWKKSVSAFLRALDDAQRVHRRELETGHTGPGQTIQARMGLAGIADEIHTGFVKMEKAIRDEMA